MAESAQQAQEMDVQRLATELQVSSLYNFIIWIETLILWFLRYHQTRTILFGSCSYHLVQFEMKSDNEISKTYVIAMQKAF